MRLVLGMSVWCWGWEPKEERGGDLEVISGSGCQEGFLEKGKDEKGLRERMRRSLQVEGIGFIKNTREECAWSAWGRGEGR